MSNLAIRIITAAAILPPLIALIFFVPKIYFLITVAAVAAIGGFEFANITYKKGPLIYKITTALFSAIICTSVGLSTKFGQGAVISIISLPVLALLLFMFSSKDLQKGMQQAALTTLGSLYAGGLFGTMALIVYSLKNGNFWFFLLLCVAVFNDTFAYASGRLFGKRKLHKILSPNKTWAGSAGGVAGSITAVMAIKMLFLNSQISWPLVPVAGTLLSISCQVGDLAESFIKRGFKIKESGKIIPGHGGILDRCDALMFGAPVVLIFGLIFQ
jgi:phosphatidate cytidylyltransferase